MVECLAGGCHYLKISNAKDIKSDLLKQILSALNKREPYKYELHIVFTEEVLNGLSVNLLKHISDHVVFPVILNTYNQMKVPSEINSCSQVWGIYKVFQGLVMSRMHEYGEGHLIKITAEAKKMHKAGRAVALPTFKLTDEHSFDVVIGKEGLIPSTSKLACMDYAIKFFTEKAQEEIYNITGNRPGHDFPEYFNISNPPLGFVVKKTYTQ